MIHKGGGSCRRLSRSGSTTHRQLEEEQQIKAGAAPNVVRISIGIEDVKDTIADLDQGLAAATA